MFKKLKISLYSLTCKIWYTLSARSTVGSIRTDVYELSTLGEFWNRNFFPFRTDWVFISMKFFNMVYKVMYCRFCFGRFEHKYLSLSNKEPLLGSVTRRMVWTTIGYFFYYGASAPSWPRPPHYRGFMITLRHTTLGRTYLDEWWDRRSL
jgi:hypothetical protein